LTAAAVWREHWRVHPLGTAPAMTSISRKLPAHDAMSAADPAVLKERAYRAWKTFRVMSEGAKVPVASNTLCAAHFSG
jgi:hypothetical protein